MVTYVVLFIMVSTILPFLSTIYLKKYRFHHSPEHVRRSASKNNTRSMFCYEDVFFIAISRPH